jgi:hypothetical protein
MNRDRAFSILLAGVVVGIVLSWACGPVVPEAQAQDGAEGCQSWEVRNFFKNDDGACAIGEHKVLGVPTGCGDEDLFSQGTSDPAAATVTIPDGFEPFAFQDNFIVARRCRS